MNRLEAIREVYEASHEANLVLLDRGALLDLLAVAEAASRADACIDCATSRDLDGQIEHEAWCSVGALLREVEK